MGTFIIDYKRSWGFVCLLIFLGLTALAHFGVPIPGWALGIAALLACIGLAATA